MHRLAEIKSHLERLAQKGYLRGEKYRGFTLTERGLLTAREVHARRRTLAAFLRLLDLPENVIQHDVNGLEHHLSEQTFERLRSFLRTQSGGQAASRR